MDREGETSGSPQEQYRTFARNRALRMPGFEYGSGYVYFVTIGIRDRKPLLSNDRLARAILDVLMACRERYEYAVYAYCLMPDHVHLLVMPLTQNGPALPAFVGAFKSQSTRAFWQQAGTGALWQTHYYDHILRKEESLTGIGEYILNNPVRKGLVSSPDGYAFCGILDEVPA